MNQWLIGGILYVPLAWMLKIKDMQVWILVWFGIKDQYIRPEMITKYFRRSLFMSTYVECIPFIIIQILYANNQNSEWNIIMYVSILTKVLSLLS